MARTQEQGFDFGEKVDGIDIPVFNERAVRASAGILFILGFSAVSYASSQGTSNPCAGSPSSSSSTWESG